MSALIATEGESKPKQLPPAGTHVARCYSVIDLGTQTTEYMGTEKTLRKIRITWELPNETAVFKDEAGEQPFVISKDYTLSLYEKANLRHDLESWRGKQFTEKELQGFDIFTLLGVPCMLTVIHKSKEGGKTYANVTGVGKLAKGMQCPDQINKTVQFSIDDGRDGVFATFPDWLREKIQKCAEWNEKEENGDGFEADPFNDDDDGDSIPF
jgi:hypothetical protein